MAGLQEITRLVREELDQLQIGSLTQELVSWEQPNGDSSKAPESIETSRQPQRGARDAECTCLYVCSRSNCALWSALPIELVHLVFARLPLPKIIQMRSLSKNWNESFESENSEFMRACSDAGSRMFAMITQAMDFGIISIKLYDTKSNRWYSFEEPMLLDMHVVTMSAGDGGLVCVVSTSMDKEVVVIVLNPLTKQWRLLPPRARRKLQPRMVQLVMDQDTKCYKVIVVDELKSRGAGNAARMVSEVYCSKTGEWSDAKDFPGLVFGFHYRWERYPEDELGVSDFFEETCHGPCAYDCAGCQLLEFNVQRILGGPEDLESYALVKDHLFVLQRKLFKITESDGCVLGTEIYVLSEYQYRVGNGEAKWVKLKVHEHTPLEHRRSRDHYSFELFACNGFLLLEATHSEDGGLRTAWLYDLLTSKWKAVPPNPELDLPASDVMYEVGWDAVP